ncbi:MAG: hypothetical protein M3285_01830 [Actinomycetota bacterium]|nr:hypothetical protein [Actinomycetota bacterium]
MSRFLRTVAAMVVVLLCLLVIPGAYTAAEKKAEAADGQAAPSPTPTPEEGSPSPDPTPAQPTEEPTEPGEPDPEPTASAEPEPPTPTPPATGSSRQTRNARAVAAELSVNLTASPDEIALGESATISTEVANDGDDPADDAHVDVFVPTELDVVSTSPSADSQTTNPDVTTVGFELGDLAPNDSQTVTVVVEAIEEADDPLTVAADATAAGDLFASDSATLTVAQSTGTLAVSTSSGGLLTQVGSTTSFGVTVSNPGSVPLENVAVIDIAPREIDVIPPTKLPKGVDAVQVGTSGSLQDIVWIIDKLPPGKKLSLSWKGVVDSAGDLAAVNTVTATADNADDAKAQTRAYLVQPGGSSTSNPPVQPRTRRIVTRRQVVVRPPILARPATETSVSESSTGEALPFTGVDPGAIALIAVALVGMGIGLLFLARRGVEARRLTSVALLALLLGTACMANDGDPSATPEISPRVKGTQIERGDGNDAGPDQDTQDQGPDGEDNTDADRDTTPDENDGDPSTDIDNDPPADDSDDDVELPGDPNEDLAGPTAPEVRTVRTVRTITIGEADLPVVNLASFSGTDALSFGWNDPSTSLTHASSATSSAPGEAARLATSISPSGSGMRVTVTLSNPSSRRRLAVDGHVSLRVGGEQLSGPATNVILNPDGEVSKSFSFRLPSGNYTARPTFSAS